jgi:F0F1-type ATP synthase assembly protein I
MAQEPDEKRAWLEYSAAGLMFPASIAVGVAIGYLLDKWLHTEPWLLVLFMFYGAGAGFYHVYKIARRDGKKK